MSTIKNVNEKVMGQFGGVIDIGDRGVVTKMKRVRKKITFSYIPSQKEYSIKDSEQLQKKEDALFNYIINQPIFKEALGN